MKSKPWLRHGARPSQLEVYVRDEQPLLELRIYTHAVLLTRRRGPEWSTYPIAPDALTEAFANAPHSSGLLPTGTIATGRAMGQPYYVQFIPPRPVELRLRRTTSERTWSFQAPALIWAGCARDYRIWALHDPGCPDRADAPLCVAPFPNCRRDGTICWGSASEQRPATPAGLPTMLDLFLRDSAFNDHLADGKSKRKPHSIVALYAELTPGDPYPIDDLISTGMTLEQAINGRVWGAR